MTMELIKSNNPGSLVAGVPVSLVQQLPEAMQRQLMVAANLKRMEDIQDFLLRGQGWSSHTVRSYMDSFKNFHRFLHGEQVLISDTLFRVAPSDIEKWFSTVADQVDPKTAALRIAGVRAVYRSLEQVFPASSPFRDLPSRLEKKLKPKAKILTALRVSELNKILSELVKDKTPLGLTTYAAMLLLSTSGLRAAEALSLSWKDIGEVDGQFIATGIGKGSKPFRQELYPASVLALRNAFRAVNGRDPGKNDKILYAMPSPIKRKGQGSSEPTAMTYITLYRRIQYVGAMAQAKGLIKREMVFSPHLLRRTYATVLHDGGMSAKAVQGKTRHSNIETLERHYLKSEAESSPIFDKVLDIREAS